MITRTTIVGDMETDTIEVKENQEKIVNERKKLE